MKVFNQLLHLIFPKLCLLCNEPLIEGEKQICLSCVCRLPYTRFQSNPENNPAYQLFIGKTDIRQAMAYLYFEKGSSTRKLIHAIKYQSNSQLGYDLGCMASLELAQSGFMDNIDILIPVPLHPKREKKRGFNQSLYIARGIQSVFHLSIDSTTLTRNYTSMPQVQQTFYERWDNVQQLFALNNPSHLKNKHILLIDDVVTSGSTLSACANLLLSVPGIRISIFSLAITR